jgi:hypothetical protein
MDAIISDTCVYSCKYDVINGKEHFPVTRDKQIAHLDVNKFQPHTKSSNQDDANRKSAFNFMDAIISDTCVHICTYDVINGKEQFSCDER